MGAHERADPGHAGRALRVWREVEAAPLVAGADRESDAYGRKNVALGDAIAYDKDEQDYIEWDSEILKDEPGRRIAWRSIGGESDNAGEVIFEPAPGGRGTMVTVLQEFRMGKLASAWETIVGAIRSRL